MEANEFGQLKLQIEALLRQKNISKNRICKDLDIPRTNLNRYCTLIELKRIIVEIII